MVKSNDAIKSRFGKISKNEFIVLVIILTAGILFSLGVQYRQSSQETHSLIATLVAAGLYVVVVLIRSKSANDVQIRIDVLEKRIEELENKDKIRSDNQ